MKVFLIPDKKQFQVTLAALALLCASYTAGTALTPTAYAAEQVETPRISVSVLIGKCGLCRNATP